VSADASRLLPTVRQQHMRQLIQDHGVVRVTELAERFGVSEMTVRRDLEVLEAAGHLERTFGGAVAAEQSAFESSYMVRLQTQVEDKACLARYAATLVQPGDTVALDASTTSLALAKELARLDITVITNSLDVAQELRSASPRVILTGGYLRQVAGSFAGPLACHMLSEMRVDHLFFSAKGLLVPDGLMDSDLDEIEVKRAMFKSSARKTALVDCSKFGKRALGRIVSLAELDLLVTNDTLKPEYKRALVSYQVPTHYVAGEGQITKGHQ
jgi:DeoR family fructose operon transcriptional repressor